jgi:hypothetical protein
MGTQLIVKLSAIALMLRRAVGSGRDNQRGI